MKLLVLGGTVFVGRHVVEAALARGHDVAIFTRGRTNTELFPEVQHLHGDRDGRLDALAGRRWDACVDTSGFVPRVVRQSAELLRGSVGTYAFLSSLAVHAEHGEPYDEDAPVRRLSGPASEDVAREYGALKAACERVVQDVFGAAALVIRPGLVVGPWDPSGRFTYWPRRIAEGGRVLAPGSPDDPVQFVDVRDLAAFVVALCERGVGGVFAVTGPAEPLTRRAFLELCRTVTGSDAELVWVPDERLVAAGVTPIFELPLWRPGGGERAVVARALAAGLRLRPVEETIRDTLAWDRTLAGEPPRQEDGRYRIRTLARGRERELLA